MGVSSGGGLIGILLVGVGGQQSLCRCEAGGLRGLDLVVDGMPGSRVGVVLLAAMSAAI